MVDLGLGVPATLGRGNYRDNKTVVLADVCRELEIVNASDAASRLDDDEKDNIGITDAIGRKRPTAPLKGLVARRRRRDITQAEAGSWIGMSKQQMSMVESGRARLDLKRGRILAERLGCTMEELL